MGVYAGDLASVEGVDVASPLTRRPMSIVYYFPPENLTTFQELRKNTTLRPNIIVDYVIQVDPESFPINVLRNKGLKGVRV